ncbi:hypothetical protein ACFFRR_000581 [Megaselia abdita]
MFCHSHNWVRSSLHSSVPMHAIVGGVDSDGSTIYIGRTYYEGDHLPVKIVPAKQLARASWGGREIQVHDFEYLTGLHYCWIPCHNGNVPHHAVSTGKTRSGETLYVGRGSYHGSLTVGKIHPSHRCLYIPYGDAEHKLDCYEVLVRN